MSWEHRVHLITDKEIKGIDKRLDRLISLHLHYKGELKFFGGNKTERYCYTVEYVPSLIFIINDYREMEILQQRISWGTKWVSSEIGKMSDDSVSGMNIENKNIFKNLPDDNGIINIDKIIFQVETM
ncbi:MAG: hypothetical protein FWF81_13300 [Defluviitaleaceae bacterium]|nr:hypothetical protein [Defluviitaleaceae bacterium]